MSERQGPRAAVILRGVVGYTQTQGHGSAGQTSVGTSIPEMDRKVAHRLPTRSLVAAKRVAAACVAADAETCQSETQKRLEPVDVSKET